MSVYRVTRQRGRTKLHSPNEPMSPWEALCRELRRGAPKKLRQGPRQERTTPLTARAEAVLAPLTDEPQMARDLAPVVGLNTHQANTAILQLSARGLATRTREGWVRS